MEVNVDQTCYDDTPIPGSCVAESPNLHPCGSQASISTSAPRPSDTFTNSAGVTRHTDTALASQQQALHPSSPSQLHIARLPSLSRLYPYDSKSPLAVPSADTNTQFPTITHSNSGGGGSSSYSAKCVHPHTAFRDDPLPSQVAMPTGQHFPLDRYSTRSAWSAQSFSECITSTASRTVAEKPNFGAFAKQNGHLQPLTSPDRPIGPTDSKSTPPLVFIPANIDRIMRTYAQKPRKRASNTAPKRHMQRGHEASAFSTSGKKRIHAKKPYLDTQRLSYHAESASKHHQLLSHNAHHNSASQYASSPLSEFPSPTRLSLAVAPIIDNSVFCRRTIDYNCIIPDSQQSMAAKQESAAAAAVAATAATEAISEGCPKMHPLHYQDQHATHSIRQKPIVYGASVLTPSPTTTKCSTEDAYCLKAASGYSSSYETPNLDGSYHRPPLDFQYARQQVKPLYSSGPASVYGKQNLNTINSLHNGLADEVYSVRMELDRIEADLDNMSTMTKHELHSFLSQIHGILRSARKS